jgi:hypothetical protein
MKHCVMMNPAAIHFTRWPSLSAGGSPAGITKSLNHQAILTYFSVFYNAPPSQDVHCIELGALPQSMVLVRLALLQVAPQGFFVGILAGAAALLSSHASGRQVCGLGRHLAPSTLLRGSNRHLVQAEIASVSTFGILVVVSGASGLFWQVPSAAATAPSDPHRLQGALR